MENHLYNKFEEWFYSEPGLLSIKRAGGDLDMINPFQNICVRSYAQYAFEAGYKLAQMEKNDNK